MPDITMCAVSDCPLSPRCYRHADSGTKPSDPWQAYWVIEDSAPRGDDCPHYWPLRKSNEMIGDENGD
jgi:hypothetical protein